MYNPVDWSYPSTTTAPNYYHQHEPAPNKAQKLQNPQHSRRNEYTSDHRFRSQKFVDLGYCLNSRFDWWLRRCWGWEGHRRIVDQGCRLGDWWHRWRRLCWCRYWIGVLVKSRIQMGFEAQGQRTYSRYILQLQRQVNTEQQQVPSGQLRYEYPWCID